MKRLLPRPLVRACTLRLSGTSCGRALSAAFFLGLCLTAPSYATPDKAATFYEDALRRFERRDMPGAIVQLKNALQQDNRMLAAHLLIGRALLSNGDLKGAEAALEQAVKQGVNRGEVALPLGQTYLALGRPELVIERIPASGLPTPLQVEVLTMRGTAYVELGKPRLASESFDEARALDSTAVAPLIAEIPMLLTLGQQQRARATAAKAIELAPQNGYAWNMYASVLHASLDISAALQAYDKAIVLEPWHMDARVARASLLIDLKREDEAEKELDILTKSAGGEPRAAYLRAILASRRGDESGTAAALREAVKAIDALPAAWLSGREQLLMVGALSHHGLGNWEKSREYLNVLIVRSPRNVAAKKLLASIYVETRDYPRALSLLEPLQKASPEDPQVLFLLGSVYLAQHRYVTATELLEKAVARTGASDMNRTLAFSQLELGRAEVGLSTLEKVFAANPRDGKAGTALSMTYLRRGEAKKAVEVAAAMAARDPANPAVVTFLGLIKNAASDKAGARAAYMQVLAKDRAFRPAALNLAKLDASEGRIEDARARLSELLAKQHDAPDVLFALGVLERRARRPAEAIRHLQKADLVQRRDARPGLMLVDVYLAERKRDQALATAKDVSSKYPENVAVLLTLSRAQLETGDQESARATLHSATRLAGFDPAVQLRIARLQLAADNSDGARYSVQRALQVRPDDVSAMALAVDIEGLRGDAAKADAALKALIGKYPDRAETANAEANLALMRGRHAAALAAYRTALSRDETTANALSVARAYIAAGEPAKAAAFLDAWLRTRPNDLAALKALAETQFRAGQLADARRSYARVVATDMDDPATLNNYASLLQKVNDPQAQAYAEQALKLEPNNPDYADTLGWILVQKGEIEPGLRYLREARLRSPQNGGIRFHLAFALAKAARDSEARDELTAALSGSHRVAHSEQVMRLKKELGL
jgi:putative PEP-CTERM system TPR-repeat lipoprotein